MNTDPEMELYARRALGTMLAALRFWQHEYENGRVPLPFLEIATDGGELTPLSAEEIDVACEDINVLNHEEVARDAGDEVGA